MEDKESGNTVAAVNCYFMSQDGSMFKAQVHFSPYFYLQIKVRRGLPTSAVISYLSFSARGHPLTSHSPSTCGIGTCLAAGCWRPCKSKVLQWARPHEAVGVLSAAPSRRMLQSRRWMITCGRSDCRSPELASCAAG